jgi:hypothetical protein
MEIRAGSWSEEDRKNMEKLLRGYFVLSYSSEDVPHTCNMYYNFLYNAALSSTP